MLARDAPPGALIAGLIACMTHMCLQHGQFVCVGVARDIPAQSGTCLRKKRSCLQENSKASCSMGDPGPRGLNQY